MSAGRPYTPGFKASNRVIVSAQTGRTGDTVVPRGFDAEFRQALANVVRIVAERGLAVTDLAQLTIYLTRMRDDYQRMNELNVEFFGPRKPARTKDRRGNREEKRRACRV